MLMLKKAVLKTLCYADIFNWPLKEEEIGIWMISDMRERGDMRIRRYEDRGGLFQCFKTLKQQGLVDERKGHYFLTGRERIVRERLEREKYARKKLQIATQIARLLKLIPWVKLVGVTGGLAVGNSKKEDDIDFLIITSAGRLWLTRFLVIILVSLTGKRRLPQDKNIADKICLNMFLDEAALEIKPQDLYMAHEVCQMKVLWEKDGTYQKFLAVNRWVKKFMPKAIEDIRILRYQDIKKKNQILSILISYALNILEFFAKKIQLYYMSRRRTTEYVSDTLLRFHPQDARNWVLAEYQKRIEKLNLGS